MTVVVVGAGLAGLRTAEALRDSGYDGGLVVLGDEAHPPYDRPPLSKAVLRGEREPFPLGVADGVDLRLSTTVTGLDLDARTVVTEDGPVAFEQLVIATGSEARRLPGRPGLALRTLDDTVALRERLHAGGHLGVVGAGLIGCEVAASARAMGVEVSVVDVLPAPLVRVLGPVVAERVRALHEEHGVRFHLGTGVGSASARQLELTDGTVLEVDVVLESLGGVPTTGWLEGSGLVLDNGVVCDETGLAAPGVWAVGDCARWGDHRHEHWTSATEQATAVASAVLGSPTTVTGPAYWWSDQYDVKLQGLGAVSADDDVAVVEVGPKQRPLAVYSSGGVLTGVVGFSAGAFVQRARGPLAERMPVEDYLAAL